MIRALKEYEANVTIYDPWANPEEVRHEYGLEVLSEMPDGRFNAIVSAVKHREFEKTDYWKLVKSDGTVYQVK